MYVPSCPHHPMIGPDILRIVSCCRLSKLTLNLSVILLKMLVGDTALILNFWFSHMGVWAPMRLYFYIVFAGSMLAWTWRNVLGEESRFHKLTAGNLSFQRVAQICMHYGFRHPQLSSSFSVTHLCSVEVRDGTKVLWDGMHMCVSVLCMWYVWCIWL